MLKKTWKTFRKVWRLWGPNSDLHLAVVGSQLGPSSFGPRQLRLTAAPKRQVVGRQKSCSKSYLTREIYFEVPNERWKRRPNWVDDCRSVLHFEGKLKNSAIIGKDSFSIFSCNVYDVLLYIICQYVDFFLRRVANSEWTCSRLRNSF